MLFQLACSFSSLFGMRTNAAQITAAKRQTPKLNHHTALYASIPSSEPSDLLAWDAIVAPIAAIVAVERFCAVIRKLPAAPWHDFGTLEVMKMEMAAKDMSGPNVVRHSPGKLRAQYIVPAVCGRKKTGPSANATMLPIKM